MQQLNPLLDKSNDKAECCFLKGWLLNIKNDYDKEVFDLLTKAIKLKPDFEEAWIELGECYFKKGDFKLALNCFEKVIKQNAVEKKALRNASIMLRSIQCTPEEKKQNIKRSIELAKKAVECDFGDGNSWAILGNAYLTLLFMSSKANQGSLIKNCKSAYQKALIDDRVKVKADVLFNYASILQHQEEFEEMLVCLSNACKYDPDWKELEERKQHLLNFVCDICQKIVGNTLNKSKRLTRIKDSLKIEEEKLQKAHVNSADLCHGAIRHIEELSEGSNDCLLVCRVVSYTTDSHNVFLCSVLYVIDSNGQSIVLFIYDLIANKGPKPGDSLVILRPFVKNHEINFESKKYSFKAIKIANPLAEVFVNNKRLSVDCISIPVVSVTLKSD